MFDPSKRQPRRNPSENAASTKGAGLYLHFPFCLYKCHYCDFNSYAYPQKDIPFLDYRVALKNELNARKALYEKEGKHFFDRGHRIESIFFGGGTPSLMPAGDVAFLLEEIDKLFLVDPQVEITLEANPKTVDVRKLAEFKAAGINRLSVGIQSLHDAYLSAFGRIHSADDAREAIRLIASTGFQSWNADLIFGFPGQTLKEWEEDLAEILKFNPPHLSCYSFTVEEGTIYHRQFKKGEVVAPSEDLQAEMFEVTGRVLEEEGYRRYEISNFCRPGFESRHNVNYWNYGEYLGIGAGAVSFLHNGLRITDDGFRIAEIKDCFGYRTTNFKEPRRYMQAVIERSEATKQSTFSVLPLDRRVALRAPRDDSQMSWFDEEPIPFDTAMAEFMMMGLRLEKGISAENFERFFECSVHQKYGRVLSQFEKKGWMNEAGSRLTAEGRLFANQIIGEMLP